MFIGVVDTYFHPLAFAGNILGCDFGLAVMEVHSFLNILHSLLKSSLNTDISTRLLTCEAAINDSFCDALGKISKSDLSQ